MNKVMRAVRGVTLLEVMLVLAIAAMIIVMSVRYYQSAQASSQSNAFVSQIQAYVAAAENLSQGTGSFTTGASLANMQAYLPGGVNAWNVPWGSAGTYAPVATGFTFGGYTAPTGAVCSLITAKFTGNTKISITATCTTVTYDSSK